MVLLCLRCSRWGAVKALKRLAKVLLVAAAVEIPPALAEVVSCVLPIVYELSSDETVSEARLQRQTMDHLMGQAN